MLQQSFSNHRIEVNIGRRANNIDTINRSTRFSGKLSLLAQSTDYALTRRPYSTLARIFLRMGQHIFRTTLQRYRTRQLLSANISQDATSSSPVTHQRNSNTALQLFRRDNLSRGLLDGRILNRLEFHERHRRLQLHAAADRMIKTCSLLRGFCPRPLGDVPQLQCLLEVSACRFLLHLLVHHSHVHGVLRYLAATRKLEVFWIGI